ncbi:transcriptional regulator, TetR family [Solimonas aquatica]|uniref:Transcriptional regulator, TetR family n=1 Tax=Solimonas aquatica TaxID=489703 RepID=A0A1H9BBF4_9GAMM|nr:TetR/AcrR family transcriptional regulator [Solimonas aquatica]SEP86199.1 transcriptional regulator, TetR family [Solimonas aquatica]
MNDIHKRPSRRQGKVSKTESGGGQRLPTDVRAAGILAAAREVIDEKGYESVLISDIAKRAGVVDGTIYRYFKNKRDLLEQVAQRWFGEQLAMDSQLNAVKGTRNKLRHLAWRTLAIIRREPVLARFMLMELRHDPRYRSTPFFEMNKRFTQDVIAVCTEAVVSGEFLSDVSPNMLRDMLHGCIEHRTWAFLQGEGDFDIEEVADGIATVIYRGMLAKRELAQGGLYEAVKRIESVAGKLEDLMVGKS